MGWPLGGAPLVPPHCVWLGGTGLPTYLVVDAAEEEPVEADLGRQQRRLRRRMAERVELPADARDPRLAELLLQCNAMQCNAIHSAAGRQAGRKVVELQSANAESSKWLCATVSRAVTYEEPSVAHGGLIDHVNVVSSRLIVHAPTAIGKL
jgi:hypothetical protein